MEHHAPHSSVAFEGYYNKFKLPSGAHLILIICRVYGAKTKPNKLSITYVPTEDVATRLYQKNYFVDELVMRRLDDRNAFILDIPGVGSAKWDSEGLADYNFDHDDFSFHAKTTSVTPWSTTVDTPEGMLVHLPLPLHWHVQSLASDCTFTLRIPDYNLAQEDMEGASTVHQEKNYATSFPSAHIWIQAREGERGICCAGGHTMGMDAFLLGYRSKDLNLDFRPPFAVRILGLSPFMSYQTNWNSRKFQLSLQSFRRKVTLEAQAPHGTFFSLNAPFREGHRENSLGQSLQATIRVKIYESGWLTPWRLVRDDVFVGGSLEFGAGYYPPAYGESKIN